MWDARLLRPATPVKEHNKAEASCFSTATPRLFTRQHSAKNKDQQSHKNATVENTYFTYLLQPDSCL